MAATRQYPGDGIVVGPSIEPEQHDGVVVRILPVGPLAVRGPMTLTAADGTELATTSRATLCRCGGSANKPFCDGAHRTNGFES